MNKDKECVKYVLRVDLTNSGQWVDCSEWTKLETAIRVAKETMALFNCPVYVIKITETLIPID